MNQPMPLSTHIEVHRQTLLAIITTLFALAGFTPTRASQSIPHKLRLEILRTLRPAEAALRRLIVIAARGLILKPGQPRTMPPGLAKELRHHRQRRTSLPVFQLSDHHIPIAEPARRAYAKKAPRIFMIAPIDPTVAAIWQAHAAPPVAQPVLAEPENEPLTRRLEAMRAALENLPAQARRMLRWIARRKAMAKTRLIHCSPLRAGRAPYLPPTPLRDVDFVLERCHLLAREALSGNTS
jgi:hypothetical protein